MIGRGAALDGLELQGANADAIGPTTDMVDKRFALDKPATLDGSSGILRHDRSTSISGRNRSR